MFTNLTHHGLPSLETPPWVCMCVCVCVCVYMYTYLYMHVCRYLNILYSRNFLRDRIFADFTVGLTSAKMKSANKTFSWFYHAIVASICESFVCEFSLLEPSAKILSRENFPLYSMYVCIITMYICTTSACCLYCMYRLFIWAINFTFSAPPSATGWTVCCPW